MLIDDVSPDRSCFTLNFHAVLNLFASCLKEATQGLEKSHDFWLRQNIREYLKVSAELRIALEVHQEALLVSIMLVKRHHSPMNTP